MIDLSQRNKKQGTRRNSLALLFYSSLNVNVGKVAPFGVLRKIKN
jgi:hypothetical protein